ncbi:MAG: RNA polymerase sigma factor [Pseudomonadota bacterium]
MDTAATERAAAPSPEGAAACTPIASLHDLIAGIASGSEQAMGEFYERTVDRAHAVARAILPVVADAEEAMMEAYLQVWRQAGRYCAERASPATWLLMMVRSRALDLLRKRCNEGERQILMDQPPEPADDSARPERLLTVLDEHSAVARAIGRLTPAQRDVISLGFFRDLSHAQIAEALGLPLGTVKSHSRRAMKAMRSHLADETRPPSET